MRLPRLFSIFLSIFLLAACGTAERRTSGSTETIRPVSQVGNEVVFYALGLIDTGYRFGGKNPEAGLDCSGMVSYIYGRAARSGYRQF